jgi:hypothetical protein
LHTVGNLRLRTLRAVCTGCNLFRA